jgi:glutathione S-transferase
MRRTLYGLSQSPWTERARWALDHHGLEHAYREHMPMVGELLLRRRAARARGAEDARKKKPSVPLLVDGDAVVMGSFEIAKHADAIGRGAALFPRDADPEMARWVDVAERMTGVGRAWVLRRILESPGAQAESVPGFVPGPLRGALAPTVAMAVRFLLAKYAVPTDVRAEIDRTLRPLLEEVRGALAGAKDGGDGRQYLLGQFSFADMAVAATLHVLRPRAGSDLGPATRAAWTNEELAAEFGDLVRWRDAVYAKHR